MKTFKRKGFTLVELLIVIVVIGVLSAMMMLASNEAVTSAKALRIINDLSLIKRAVNAWYLDNHQRLAITTANNGYFIDAKRRTDGKYEGGTRLHDYLNNHPEEIAKYFSTNNVGINMSKGNWTHASRDQYYATTGNYGIYFGYSNTICYVLYKISDHNDDIEARLKAKLKARAESAGLLVYDYLAGNVKHKYYDGKSANVFMEAFKLN